MEELYIKNIEAGMRKIRLNPKMDDAELLETKQKIARNLNLLMKLNVGMYEELFNKYKLLITPKK